MKSDADVLRERALKLAKPVVVPAIDADALIVFRLADSHFAVPSSTAREVFKLRSFTPIPGAVLPLTAITVWRGTVLRLLDIREQLGLMGSALNDLSHVIVIGTAEARFGILVDRVDRPGHDEETHRFPRESVMVAHVTGDGISVLNTEYMIEVYG